MSTFNIDFSEN